MTAPFTPQMLAPSAPGQLSNTRGSNTGADAIGLKQRYANPKGANMALSLLRIVAQRTALSGLPSSPQSAWDSGWMGGVPAVQQLPTAKSACGGNNSVVYNGRMYFMPSDGTISSAPVASAAVGTWRSENPVPPFSVGSFPAVYSCSIVANRIYCIASGVAGVSSAASMFVATINADGTLGTWTIVPGGVITQSNTVFKGANGTGMVGGWDGVSATGFIITWGSDTAYNQLTPLTYTVNIADGSITLPGVAAAGNPTLVRDSRTCGFIGTDLSTGQGYIFLIGGPAIFASPIVDGSPINLSTGGAGTFAAKQALPAARIGGTLIKLQDGGVYYIGGSSSGAAGAATTTVYYTTVTNLNNAVAWNTSAQVLASATWLAGGGIAIPDYDTGPSRVPNNNVTTIVTAATVQVATSSLVSFKPAGTIALVGVKGAFTTGTNLAVTGAYGQATTAGNLLVCVVSCAANNATTVTAGWVKALQSANGTECDVWYKRNCGASEAAPAFTATTSGGTAPMHAQLFEFSGAKTTADVLGFTGTVNINGALNGLIVTESGTDTEAGDLIIGGSRWAFSANGTATFSDAINNATVVQAGDSGGSGTINSHSDFIYGIAAGPVLGKFPYLVVCGGQTNAGANRTTVVIAAVNPASTPHDIRAWSTNAGVGTAAAVGNFGTGAALVTNSDGTQDATVNYGAVGTLNAITVGQLLLAGFNDGDQVTLSVTMVGLDGDLSSAAITVLKIGQAPTLASIAPSGSTSDGRPILSFSFIPGAGGGLELSYQIQLKQGANVIFDSGVRYDGLNSIQTLLAPYLLTATVYTIVINVTSTDSPMPGSSNTATSSATTFTPTLTSPGTPSALTATPNNAGGFVALAWTNNAPAGTTPGNRVYYRRNGTSVWFLLLDSAAAITTFNAYDRLALAVAYDFAVSQIDNTTHAESPLSNIVLNKTIDPVAGGYSAFLHVQGSNVSNALPVAHSIGLLAQDTPTDKAKLDMRTSLPFQQLAPVARFGVAHYAELSLKIFTQDLAHFKSLQDAINTSFAGNPLVYRDGFGAMVIMSPMSDHGLVYKPPLFREVQVALLQVPDVAGGWSIGPGLAQGYQSQQSGSAIPLDSSELIL